MFLHRTTAQREIIRIENRVESLLFVSAFSKIHQVMVSATLRLSNGEKKLVIPKMPLIELAQASSQGEGANLIQGGVSKDDTHGIVFNTSGIAYFKVNLTPFGSLNLVNNSYLELEIEGASATDQEINIYGLQSPYISKVFYAWENEQFLGAVKNKEVQVNDADMCLMKKESIDTLEIKYANNRSVELSQKELIFFETMANDASFIVSGAGLLASTYFRQSDSLALPLKTEIKATSLVFDTTEETEIFLRKTFRYLS